MIKVENPQNCCGCSACASICEHNAISMEPDALGFLYPRVDEGRCIGCGLCEKVCQFNENYDQSQNLSQPKAYAARHKDKNEIMRSRSGAAFVAISDYIIEKGGVVYGAGYKDHFRVTHKRAATKAERDEFRGSKYVQSDLTGVFRQVREDLKRGLTVLFSGTPCQTSGLIAFVGTRLRQNLVVLDIVCHGVPGPYIWRDYILYLEKKQGDVVSVVNFRDKVSFGWKAHKESYLFKNGLVTSCAYTFLFYKHIMFRYSCGVCYFTNLRRPSDITLADFWGWQKNVPGMNEDDRGLSLVFINTEKGKAVFEAIKKVLDVKEVDVNNCLQPNLLHPSAIHPERERFEELYVKRGFEYVFKRYGEDGWRNKVVVIIKKAKRIIKIIIGWK